MASDSVVFVGAGDLAKRALRVLHSANIYTAAIARTPKELPCDAFWQGSVRDEHILQKIVALKPAALVITLVPNGQGEQGYYQGYIAPLKVLLATLSASGQVPTIIFASSTGVYHQVSGEWVDELSPTEPSNYSGETMLQAERMLRESGLPHCSVRFGGIYGSGRDFLIRQVQAGKGGGPEYSNRIHQDDAARCLAFLADKALAGTTLPECLIACDSEPESSAVVRAFIAEQLELRAASLTPSASGRGGNKRCSNKKLLAMGFDLHYPSYRDGYRLQSNSEAQT